MSGLEPTVEIVTAAGQGPAPQPAPTPPQPTAPRPVSPLSASEINRTVYATDDLGRAIGVKRLTALDMFDLSLVLGEHANNQAVLNQALIAASVVSIDGRNVDKPQSPLQIRARIKELDFQGYAAAAKALGEFSAINPNDEAAKSALKA